MIYDPNNPEYEIDIKGKPIHTGRHKHPWCKMPIGATVDVLWLDKKLAHSALRYGRAAKKKFRQCTMTDENGVKIVRIKRIE